MEGGRAAVKGIASGGTLSEQGIFEVVVQQAQKNPGLRFSANISSHESF